MKSRLPLILMGLIALAVVQCFHQLRNSNARTSESPHATGTARPQSERNASSLADTAKTEKTESIVTVKERTNAQRAQPTQAKTIIDFSSPKTREQYNRFVSTFSLNRAQEQLRDSGFDTQENLDSAYYLIINGEISPQSFQSRILAATHLALSSRPEAALKRKQLVLDVEKRIAESSSTVERQLLALDVRSIGDHIPFQEIDSYADLFHETDSPEIQEAIIMGLHFRTEKEILDPYDRKLFFRRLGIPESIPQKSHMIGNSRGKHDS